MSKDLCISNTSTNARPIMVCQSEVSSSRHALQFMECIEFGIKNGNLNQEEPDNKSILM